MTLPDSAGRGPGGRSPVLPGDGHVCYPSPVGGRATSIRWAARLVLLALAAVTLAIFGRLAHYPFVAIDDPTYVTDNPQVRAGLTAAGLRWAWTTFHEANWHPLTWISHQLDVSFFGLDPGAHHLVNVLLHLANSLLLFHLLRTLAGRLWAAAGVAALFAVHPLHVESVAWVAERKDVLSTFFLLLTLLAYQRRIRRPSPARVAAVPALFALSLLSKPMAVTLPALLLLLDWWPLGRFGGATPAPGVGDVGGRRIRHLALLREKTPLVLLSLASAAVTYVAQLRGGAVSSLEAIPLGWRVQNAVVSSLRYLGKTLWPDRLAVFYPHPGGALSVWLVAGAALTLGVACAAALAQARRSPYLAVGWFWFLVTLLPVIGLVQVGGQAMADRYSYLPLVGIFILACWGLSALAGQGRAAALALPLAAVGALSALSVAAWIQVGHYRSAEALFLRTLATTRGNFVVHTNLGALYAKAGDLDAAERQYQAALAIRPNGAIENFNCGDLLVKRKRHAEAVPYLRRALAADPDYPQAHYYLGMYLAQRGDATEARFHLGRALRSLPENQLIRFTLERLERRAQP